MDDCEEVVLEKLTSEVAGDDGLPTGFPQLKEGKGFELLSCVTNSRDLAVVKSSWSVERLKTLFTPQTKIYLEGKLFENANFLFIYFFLSFQVGTEVL